MKKSATDTFSYSFKNHGFIANSMVFFVAEDNKMSRKSSEMPNP